jgi:hypothetical protein
MSDKIYLDLDPELEEALYHYMFGPIWDGNVNSKFQRDQLFKFGLIKRAQGFQFISTDGVMYLYERERINQDTWRNNPFVSRMK